MAIVGTFEADFSQFTSAVRGAETQLRSLEGGSQRVVSSIDSMAGVLRGLATAFGVTFSAAAVINFGREVLRTADELTKLSDRTGLSTRTLQQFQIAGDDAGNTVGEITAAVVQMQDRLTGGDRSAVRALERLGLSLHDIMAMPVGERLIAISDAMRKIEDPTELVNIAMDLFGRTGANVLPTLKRGFDDVRDGAVGMSEASVKALDDFGDAIGRATRSMTAFAGEHLGRSIEGWQILGELMDGTVKQMNVTGPAAQRLADSMKNLPPPGIPEDLKAIERELNDQAAVLAKATAEVEKAAAAYRALISEVRNEEGLAQMKAMEETMARAAENQEGLWLMERDAWQLQLAAREDAAAALHTQAAAEAAMQAQVGEGLTVIGQSAAAHAEAGATAFSATSSAQQGYAALASTIGTATQAAERFTVSHKLMMELGEAARHAGYGGNRDRLSGQQEALLRGFEIVTARGGAPASATTVNVNVSGVFDTNAKRQLTEAVSQGLTQSILQGSKVAA